MARVRLCLDPPDHQPHTYQFYRPDGSIGAIKGLRLKAFVRFLGRVDVSTGMGKKAAFPECVVDTGSFLTIVPEKIWRYFLPGVVTRLRFHPSMPLHDRRLTIAGGTFPYELGQLVIPLVDQEGNSLDATVVAKLTRDGGSLNVPLTLGLRGGVIDGRILRSESDSTVPHGQRSIHTDP